ncbi:hypothetical protein STEG23_008312 [Scotinomys teguina]
MLCGLPEIPRSDLSYLEMQRRDSSYRRYSWGIDTLPSGYQRLKMPEFLSKPRQIQVRNSVQSSTVEKLPGKPMETGPGPGGGTSPNCRDSYNVQDLECVSWLTWDGLAQQRRAKEKFLDGAVNPTGADRLANVSALVSVSDCDEM